MAAEEQQHNDFNNFQGAIEAIEALTALYKIKYTMTRTKNKIWKIQVMGKIFQSSSFKKASQEAIVFAYLAHNNTENDTQRSPE